MGPVRERCGVADYTAYVVEALRAYVEVAYTLDPAALPAVLPAADLVHVQHQYFLFGGVAPWKNWFPRFTRRLQVPAVMTVHEFVQPGGSAARRAAVRLTNDRQFRDPRIRRLIVHTEQDRRLLTDAGVESSRIALIRHAVPGLPELPERDRCRRILGVQDRFVTVILGFLSQKKGHRLALDAIRKLPREVVLLIAGGRHPDDTSRNAEELYELASSPDLAGRVRITGYLSEDELLQAACASDLVLAPFTASSGSGSLALALAAGKPILASDIPPHRELLDVRPGMLATFGAGDADDLAAQVDRLRRDADALDTLRNASRQYAAEHSYARAAEETVAIYRTVLAERSP